MAKIRVHEIAKELGVENKAVIDFLSANGADGKSASSGLEEDVANSVRKHFGKKDEKAEAVRKPKLDENGNPIRKIKLDENGNPIKKAKPSNDKAAGKKNVFVVTRSEDRNHKKPAAQTNAAPAQKSENNAKNNNVNRGPIRPRNLDGIRPSQRASVEEEVEVVETTVVETAPVVEEKPVEAPAAVKLPKGPSMLGVIDMSADKKKENRPNSENRGRDGRDNRNRDNRNRDGQGKGRPEGGSRQGEKHFNKNDRNGGDNAGKTMSFDRRNNGQGGAGKGMGSKSAGNMAVAGGPSAKEGQNRRDHGKNNKHNQERDALGKKQEQLLNLEKNGGKKKKPQNNTPKLPERNEDEILNITLPDRITVKDLCDRMKMAPNAVIKSLFMKGKVVTVNQELDYDSAEEIALEFNCICEHEEKVDVIAELLANSDVEEDESALKRRPPVVCVMGHVDHGKTSLLDAIRDTRVTDREAGGITQAIGAYVVSINGENITFLDTPGHEAFTAMRMRGANSTDIAILVVAADDGVMPQTVEAINHAKAAGVEIIVAINKIDKPGANIDRVKQELAEYQLIPEDWGGSTVFCPVSAKTHEGIENLLEMILLTADVLELKANPKRNARGIVIEAQLDKGRGAVATVLVQKGTLHVGDPVACGSVFGKVRAMQDDQGRRVKEAGPSIPVEILGLSDVPNAGEVFVAMDSEKEARSFAETFVSENKNRLIEETKAKMSLDDLFSQIQAGNLKELNIIVKADVQGSVEAVRQSLEKLSNDEVVVRIIHGGVGAINESDVVLASASNAIIIGFNVRPDAQAKTTAEHEGVDVRLYKVIYNAIEDVEAAMKGMLDPIFEEKIIGHAEVRAIFKASGVGNIAGSYVMDGIFQRDCGVRVFREGKMIFEGKLASLKRFKDDVKEVKTGFECGLVIDGFSDFMEFDQIESYIMVEVPR